MNDLDKYFVQHLGGVDNNSLINILDMDTNENLDSDQPQLICHSPYYDSNKFISTLKKGKDEFSILRKKCSIYKCKN